MRFHYGAIPEVDDFQPESEGWRAIREPNPILLQVMAVPAALALVLAWMLLIFLFLMLRGTSFEFPTSNISFTLSLVTFLLILLLIIPLHELLHALSHPGWGLSAKTIIGMWISRGLFYAHYEGVMSRNRFLLISVTPCLVLGVLPAVVWGIFPGGWWSADMSQNLLFLSLTGTLAASGDFVGAVLMYLQIPNSAIIRNKGWRTYWKPGPLHSVK